VSDDDERPVDPDAMSDHDLVLAAVDRLAPALVASGLAELEVEAGNLWVRLARPRSVSMMLPGMVARPGVPDAAAMTHGGGAGADPSSAPHYGEAAPGMRLVTAPLTGVWYSAPSPGARPYIEVGSEIAAGQVIGLIEAMKLFNEIKSDAAGTVTRTLVDTGTLVKRQQPLIEVDPR
jgi:acetyl-CoA carboxylase biotin carboxyl carrier protein